MASTGQQVTLTVAKQAAVFHGLAMLICQDPPQSLPCMAQYFIVFYSQYLFMCYKTSTADIALWFSTVIMA